MHPAFETWNIDTETVESVEDRIHDGVAREKLRDRATGYIDTLARLFPWTLPKPGAQIMEIGSGLGYIMEAAVARLNPSLIIGLDVAGSMIEKARARLVRDGVETSQMSFSTYDGLTIPFEDNSFDYVYSVAAIQHIPKPYAYNLLFEINRVLTPQGFAAIHTLSFSLLPSHLEAFPFREECLKQIRNETGHWHFFYSRQELSYILSAALKAGWISIEEENGSLWSSFSKDREVEFCNSSALGR